MLELLIFFILGVIVGRLNLKPILMRKQYAIFGSRKQVVQRHIPYFEPDESHDTDILNCTIIENGKREDLKIPARRLSQFLSLPYPTRAYWTGDNDAFTKCRRIVNAWGWIVKDGKTYKWGTRVNTVGRRVRMCESWGIRLPSPYPSYTNQPSNLQN